MPAFAPVLAVALLVLGIAILWAVLTYNALITGGLRVDEAWATVAVQLNRRASLVPNLVETVAGYAAHERETLTSVSRARQAIHDARSAAEAETANGALTTALGHLFAVAEAYPDLKASAGFADLQRQLADLEEKIAFARQFYNRAVLEFNARISTLPSSIIATAMNVPERPFFELQGPVEAPVVKFAVAASGAG